MTTHACVHLGSWHLYYLFFNNTRLAVVLFVEEADIAAGALIVTDERRGFVDFTEPFLSLRSSALIRKPELVSPPPPSSSSSHGRRRHRRPSTTPPPRPPGRPVRRVRTASELLVSDLQYGVVHGSVVEWAMSQSDDPLTAALWSRVGTFVPPALVASVQEGVERARRGPYAFIVDSPMAAYVAGRRPCQLYMTEPFLDQMTYAFAVRRTDRRLRAAMDRELRRARYTGEMQAMYLRWWRDECSADDDVDFAVDPAAHVPASTRDVAAAKSGRHAGRSAAAAAFPTTSNDALNCRRTTSRSLCLTAAVVALLMLVTSP